MSVHPHDRGRYLVASVWIKTGLLFVLLLALAGCAAGFSWSPRIIWGVGIYYVSQLFMSFAYVYMAALRSAERMEYELVFGLVQETLFLGGVVAVVAYDQGFLALFVVRAAADLVFLALFARTAHVKVADLSPRKAPADLVRHVFTEAAPIGVFALVVVALFRIDLFVLNLFRGAEEVSLFQAPHAIIMRIQILPMGILIALFPAFSRLAARSMEALGAHYRKAFLILLVLSAPAAVLTYLASTLIILLFFGRDFMAATTSLAILSWTVVFLFLVPLQNFTLTAVGRQRLSLVAGCLALAVNLGLDLLWVPAHGFVGASYATLISYIFFFAVTFMFAARAMGGLFVAGRVLKKALAPAVATAAMAGAGLGLMRLGRPDSVVHVAGAMAAACVAYGLVLVILRVPAQIRPPKGPGAKSGPALPGAAPDKAKTS